MRNPCCWPIKCEIFYSILCLPVIKIFMKSMQWIFKPLSTKICRNWNRESSLRKHSWEPERIFFIAKALLVKVASMWNIFSLICSTPHAFVPYRSQIVSTKHATINVDNLKKSPNFLFTVWATSCYTRQLSLALFEVGFGFFFLQLISTFVDTFTFSSFHSAHLLKVFLWKKSGIFNILLNCWFKLSPWYKLIKQS